MSDDLVTFGESMLRLSPPGNERMETTGQLEVHAAGAESNTAIAAERLGAKAAWMSKLLEKAVRAAWANAIEEGGRLDEDDFYVRSARVDEGPTLKRWRPGDRGRVRRILKRGCHITVVLSDQKE